MSSAGVQPVARRPPLRLVLFAWFVVLVTLIPLVYLGVRAAQADAAAIRSILWRGKTAFQLVNTIGLAGAVLVTTVALGLPLAWLTTRAAIFGRRAWTLLAVLPLAIPGYLLAYALLAMGGPYGTTARLLGWEWPRLSGFGGAWIALSLYNLPYMFLNLRVAMRRLDPAVEEAARTLGKGVWGVFFRVTLPQLRPAIWAGGLLVVLHVIGDFGVVSLMRFETFSYALYVQYSNDQRFAVAWIGLLLVAMTLVVLVFEWRFLRGLRLDAAGILSFRAPRLTPLGRWAVPTYLFLGAGVFLSLVAPLSTLVYWATQVNADELYLKNLRGALGHSLQGAIPAAVLTATLAVPLAYLARRYRSVASQAIERSVYIGYATPALAFALGWVVFSLHVAPWAYQTLGLLVLAYSLHFLAEAVGPVRSSLFVATPRLEEAARTLGHGRLATFRRVTLPLLMPGIVASMALVFLSVMKELPLTVILAPLGFRPLSLRVWDYTNEAMYAEAAPYALAIVLFAATFVGVVLAQGREARS